MGNGIISVVDATDSADPYTRGTAWGTLFATGASIPLGGAAVAEITGVIGRVSSSGLALFKKPLINPRLLSNINRVSSNIANEPFMTELAKENGWEPPYPPDLSLREITLSENLKFVRVHVDPNKPNGAFLMRQKVYESLGYDPEVIRLYLGLPDAPIYISDVTVPANTRLLVGRIGKQESFGLMEPSGFQYQLLDLIPLENFSNTRPLADIQQQMNPVIYQSNQGL